MPPQKISLTQFLLKGLAGLAGGLAGSIILLLIFIVGSAVLKEAFAAPEQGSVSVINPLFIFIYLAMVFLGSTIANITSCTLIGLTEKTKYRRLNSTIYQIFIANILLFVITAPIYIIAIGIDTQIVVMVTILHTVLSVIMSGMTLEIMADSQYSLLGLYSTVLAILGSTVINFLALQILNSPMILLFIGLPLIWTGTGLSLGLINLAYNFMYNAYGIDFLSQNVNYGKDDVTQSEIAEETAREEETEMHHEKQSETGADFLNKNG